MRTTIFAWVTAAVTMMGCAVDATSDGAASVDAPPAAVAPPTIAPTPAVAPTLADLGKACQSDADCAPLAFPFCYPAHTEGLTVDLFHRCTMHVGDRHDAEGRSLDASSHATEVAEYAACWALGDVRHYGEIVSCPPSTFSDAECSVEHRSDCAACATYITEHAICVADAWVVPGGAWDRPNLSGDNR